MVNKPLQLADTPEKVKFCLNSNFSFKNAYHYTSLDTLHKIFRNKTIRFSKMSIMNDLKELDFAKNCNDYFFCLTKETDTVENFGMWAMYGKITEYDRNNLNPCSIGVKIKFSKSVIENIRNDFSVKFYKVGYANLLDGGDSIIFDGSIRTKSKILLNNDVLAGYKKDNAWKYENELRLRIKKENWKKDFFDIELSDEILKCLVIYPNPLSSVEECEAEFKKLDNIYEKSDIRPHFEENKYKNTYQFSKKLVINKECTQL